MGQVSSFYPISEREREILFYELADVGSSCFGGQNKLKSVKVKKKKEREKKKVKAQTVRKAASERC